MKKLAAKAKEQGVDLETKEGGSHTKVTIGNLRTVVPRHNEINELTANSILKDMEIEK